MLETIADLFASFFKIGLFSVGGGPATLPFLMDLAETKPWYTMRDLTDMIAVSESTPGPLGVNMATYAGYKALGLFGGLVSTLGLVLPSMIVIILIARFLSNVNENRHVQAAFKGVRPAVTALIAAAVYNLIRVSLFTVMPEGIAVLWGPIAVAAVIFALLHVKKMKGFHPALWFLFGAMAGVIFRL